MGAHRQLEHRHEPRRARDAARLRAPQLLRDLDRRARTLLADAAWRCRRIGAGRACIRPPVARVLRAADVAAALAKGSPTERPRGAGALQPRRPRAHPRRARARTTRGCRAMPTANSAWSNACTARMSSPTRMRTAWASSRSGSTRGLRAAPNCGATTRRRACSVSLDAWEPLS